MFAETLTHTSHNTSPKFPGTLDQPDLHLNIRDLSQRSKSSFHVSVNGTIKVYRWVEEVT